ncbi:hypothetical protein Bca52824_026924 [Brassica carinata]|uniref:Uncharacterized protein n=1 Tax=Brassica carinata TaxID=52824 RepID=A0A8X7VAD7_BRACI|nr:hypothetical protein Bca52824_026924 [Brassica carinata]
MGKALHGKEFRKPETSSGEMNWMFSADKDYSRRFNVLSWNLKILIAPQNHSQKDQYRRRSNIHIDRYEPTPSTTYSKHEVDESLGDIWKELKKAEAASAANKPTPVNDLPQPKGTKHHAREEMKRSIRLINEAHADMNPAAPCNPFGGLTLLKAVERKIADIHFLVDKEVEELALRIDTTQLEAEKFASTPPEIPVQETFEAAWCSFYAEPGLA